MADKKREDDAYNLRRIFEEMELDLARSLRRNLKRHEREEEEEGFRREMWQRAKLRNLQKYRRESKKIVDEISPEVERIVNEALEDNYHRGQNLFNRIWDRIESTFSKRKRVKFPKSIAHHKLSTPPPAEQDFFGVNRNKIEVMQEEAEKAKPQKEEKQEPQKEVPAVEKSEERLEPPKEQKAEPPDKKVEGQEPQEISEPFHPDGKEKPLPEAMQDKKLDNMSGQVVNDMREAQKAVWRRMDDIYRRTIYRAGMNMAAGAKTLDQAVDMATKEFLAAGIDCIEYRNGRRVNIASYAEMALRTASQRAVLLGEGKKRDEWGIHTVVVSAHANTCLLCAPWQGKVLVDDVFCHGTPEEAKELGIPLLSDAMKAGLLHPNCRHTIATYFPGITKPPEIPDKDKAIGTYNAEQQQRALERKIRKWKRKAEGSLSPENVSYANEKVGRYQEELRVHLDRHPELRRDYSREKTRGIPDNPKLFKSTGGKYDRGTVEWTLRRDDEAESYYDAMRSTNDDVRAIAKSVGWTEYSIARIKQHVFFNKHILDDGIRRFDADYNMAVAWQRLVNGKFLDRDVLLLKHEYLERVIEKKYNLTYREAHDRTTLKHDWNGVLEKEAGEYGEADNLHELIGKD